ncbi:MAG: tRNA lysidine(34) synthetase TilS [Planctomycetaceae bacterium]
MKYSAEFLSVLRAGYAECGCGGPDIGLLLAVSGGADSMALLHGTLQLWPDATHLMGVAHVNHQLRGDQSRADAEFVAAAADSLGIRYRLLTCDVRSQRQANGGSTEEVARRIRYLSLQKTAQEMGFGAVVCGHHQDDQVETILHNIIRGTGLRGLKGMSWTRPLGEGVVLIRPLLHAPRASTEEYLRGEQLAWCIDDSNACADFTRNRIRHHLLPLLSKEYNPQFVSSLLRLASHAHDAEELASQVAQRCLDDVLLEFQSGVCRLHRTRLSLWPSAVVRAALRLIWDRQSWPHQAMTQSHWTDLAASLQRVDGKPSNCPGVELSVTPTIVRIFSSS